MYARNGLVPLSGEKSDIRNFNWSFNNGDHLLTTSLELNRKTNTATIDGKAGSVWDVISNTQYERKSGLRYLNSLYTRLAVPYSFETLLDWGPLTTTNSSISFGLSGVVPGASISWDKDSKYNVKDLSSKSS
jgi:hypothetical protein